MISNSAWFASRIVHELLNCFYSILNSSSSRNKSLLSEPRETLSSLFCSIQLLPFLHEHQWVIKPICPMWPLEPSLPGLVHTFLQVSSVRNMWSISCLVVLLASGGWGGAQEQRNVKTSPRFPEVSIPSFPVAFPPPWHQGHVQGLHVATWASYGSILLRETLKCCCVFLLRPLFIPSVCPPDGFCTSNRISYTWVSIMRLYQPGPGIPHPCQWLGTSTTMLGIQFI